MIPEEVIEKYNALTNNRERISEVLQGILREYLQLMLSANYPGDSWRSKVVEEINNKFEKDHDHYADAKRTLDDVGADKYGPSDMDETVLFLMLLHVFPDFTRRTVKEKNNKEKNNNDIQRKLLTLRDYRNSALKHDKKITPGEEDINIYDNWARDTEESFYATIKACDDFLKTIKRIGEKKYTYNVKIPSQDDVDIFCDKYDKRLRSLNESVHSSKDDFVIAKSTMLNFGQNPLYDNRINAYIQSIIIEYKEFEKKELNGDYERLSWEGETSPEMCEIDSLCERILSSGDDYKKGIKFLGEAGSGKTTALKRMQYKIAKRYDESKKKKIPVLFALRSSKFENLNDIKSRTAGVLGIDAETAGLLIEEGSIIFLFDGYNEISDEKQSEFTKALGALIRERGDKIIVLSDRGIHRDSIPVLTGASRFHLHPMDMNLKKEYLKKRASDKAFHEILKESDNFSGALDEYDTPLKLNLLIELIDNTGKFPVSFPREYTNMVFKREREHGEYGLDAVRDTLYLLALYIYEKGLDDDEDVELPEVSEYCLKAVLGKVNSLGHLSIDAKRFIDVATGMKIISCYSMDNNDLDAPNAIYKIWFSCREYYMHFLSEAMDSGISDFIKFS
jgi:hypothetical protein